MALVSRLDVSIVLQRLTWLEARFENTRDMALPPPAPEVGEDACPNPNGCIYCDEFGCPRIEDPTPAIRAVLRAAVVYGAVWRDHNPHVADRNEAANTYFARMDKGDGEN